MFKIIDLLRLLMVRPMYIRTNAGRDHQAAVQGDPSSDATGDYAPACWMAVTEDGTAPAVEDLTLASEIDTGTLVRAQAVYSHVDGTGTYTLTHTFVADSTVTLRKVGVFNAETDGDMVWEALLDPTVTMVDGDDLTITVTVTL